MKSLFLTIGIFMLIVISLSAQTPETFKYQAVVRDNGGNPLQNEEVDIKINLRDQTSAGTVLYSESFTTTTNSMGLIHLEIGNGTPISGDFTTINWSFGIKFIEILLDLNDGSGFISMGASQLLSVPYSIHASKTSGLVNMSSDERDAITDPYPGMQIFNSDTRKINYYDSYGWIEVNGIKQADFNCGNPLLDSRDGKYYNTVEIAGVCWMAENLNYGMMINGSDDQSDNGIVEKYCYSNNPSLCDNTYGALYQWKEMMQYNTTEGMQGICPEEWHLPTDTEYTSLINATGGPNNAGLNLAEGGSSGFEALMAGQTNLFSYPFIEVGQKAYFWSSTQVNSNDAYYIYLQNGSPVVTSDQKDKDFGFSVRCVKD